MVIMLGDAERAACDAEEELDRAARRAKRTTARESALEQQRTAATPAAPPLDPDAPRAAFRALLRGHRDARRWSQERLAAEAEMDHSLVSRWESGQRSPTRDGLEKICAGLQLTREEADHLWVAAGFVPRDLPAADLMALIAAFREAGPGQIKAALHLIREGEIWRHSKGNGL